ncbi:MAG: hypothetical protein JOZ41_17395 [Chloroflexi bacterium]|nr:hypothetical protein [Chloroflexota bacterium]
MSTYATRRRQCLAPFDYTTAGVYFIDEELEAIREYLLTNPERWTLRHEGGGPPHASLGGPYT